jgi:hypothetical protein
MSYTANFEQATVVYELGSGETLNLYEHGETHAIPFAQGMGYEHEIKHMVKAILSGESTDIGAIISAVDGLAMVEAEALSIKSGQVQKPQYI